MLGERINAVVHEVSLQYVFSSQQTSNVYQLRVIGPGCYGMSDDRQSFIGGLRGIGELVEAGFLSTFSSSSLVLRRREIFPREW